MGVLVTPFKSSLASPTYPTRPVRIIVPLAPGGGSDAIARLLAVNLSEKFGQPFIVENKPAASGIVGTDAVAKSQPDGYTLLTVFSTHAMSAELFKKLPYDPIKDFVPVSLAIQCPQSQYFCDNLASQLYYYQSMLLCKCAEKLVGFDL